jgi:hypothetical protein
VTGSDFVSVFAQDFGFGSKILHMFPLLKSMGVLICVDFFEFSGTFGGILWIIMENQKMNQGRGEKMNRFRRGEKEQ